MPRYVFDNHFPARLARMFQALELDVASHDELAVRAGVAPRGLADVDLIRLAAAEGRVLITRDKRMQKRTAERDALRRSGVGVLFIDEAVFKSPFLEFAGRLLLQWQHIETGFGEAPQGIQLEWKMRSGVRRL